MCILAHVSFRQASLACTESTSSAPPDPAIATVIITHRTLLLDTCTGNEDVGAFMRALGYDFKSDAGAGADGLLFKQALRATHPDKNVRGDAWGRAVAAAAFPKLQEWQAEAEML